MQLRDGRKIIGILRSFDQFANLVLEAAIERVVVGNQFADTLLGLYVVRGENVVLLGEIDELRCPPARALSVHATVILASCHYALALLDVCTQTDVVTHLLTAGIHLPAWSA